METLKSTGRPKKYAQYDKLLASLPKTMNRPKYLSGIGIFRGERGDTAWVKIYLRHGGIYKGKYRAPQSNVEVPLGSLDSWSWEALEEKYKELQGKADRNEPLEEQVLPLFKDYAKEWLKQAKDRLKGAETPEYHINKHLIPAFGYKTLDAITTHDINKWQAQRLEVAKPSTVKRELATLKSIIGTACKGSHPLLKINPCKDLNQIKGISGRQRPLSGEEIATLLTEAKKIGNWLYHAINLLLHSGIRRSELLKLRWEDVIELQDGRIILQIKQTKSDKNRSLTCSPTAKTALKALKKLGGKESEKVFPYSKMTLRRGWEKIRDEANLKGQITIHDLRTTNITYAITSGVDLRTMAGRSGHSNLRMFEQHYAALVASAETEAAKTIEKTFKAMVNGKSRKRKKPHGK